MTPAGPAGPAFAHGFPALTDVSPMRLFSALTLLAILVVTARSADSAPTPAFTPPLEPSPKILAASDAEAAWQPIAQLTNMESLMALIGDARGEARQARVREIMADAFRMSLAYYQRFPQEPRRWVAVKNMLDSTRFLANDDGTAKAPVPGVTWDTAAWAVWIPQITALQASSEQATDLPDELRINFDFQQPGGLREIMAPMSKAIAEKQPVDYAPFKAELLRLADQYPTVLILNQFVAFYANQRTKEGMAKDELVAELQAFARSRNTGFAAAAQKEIDKLGIKDRPIDIAFTAVDGRQVDLKDYRGKVVLVDFWATWCGPCKAEIPNIKQVYADYHAKGFEIVGIALENARLSLDDTAEQAAAKHAKARQILTDFVTKVDMPWPQYYDGKFWKNDLAARYGIESIPAMFLIDQQGRLVSTNARGPELEKEVKRLLGL